MASLMSLNSLGLLAEVNPTQEFIWWVRDLAGLGFEVESELVVLEGARDWSHLPPCLRGVVEGVSKDEEEVAGG